MKKPVQFAILISPVSNQLTAILRRSWPLIIGSLICLSPHLSAARPIDFTLKALLPGHGNSYNIVAADLNGDSNPDLVNAASAHVFTYLGTGNGHFAPRHSIDGVGYHLGVGDFDASGFPDLAVSGSDVVYVVLNDGNGGFGGATAFPTNGTSRGIGVGDFNGDGALDLAVANWSADTVAILLGDGAGNFGAPATFLAGDQPEEIAVGDFNEDGILDLAISTYLSKEVRILEGDGVGNFTTVGRYGLLGNGSEILTADFNNDRHLDLAVGLFNPSDDGIATFLGDGRGGFTSGSSVALDDSVHGLDTADFNRDRNMDLVAATYGGNAIAVALGDGTGQFLHVKNFQFSGWGSVLPIDVAVADFDLDGWPEFVSAHFNAGEVALFQNSRP